MKLPCHGFYIRPVVGTNFASRVSVETAADVSAHRRRALGCSPCMAWQGWLWLAERPASCASLPVQHSADITSCGSCGHSLSLRQHSGTCEPCSGCCKFHLGRRRHTSYRGEFPSNAQQPSRAGSASFPYVADTSSKELVGKLPDTLLTKLTRYRPAMCTAALPSAPVWRRRCARRTPASPAAARSGPAGSAPAATGSGQHAQHRAGTHLDMPNHRMVAWAVSVAAYPNIVNCPCRLGGCRGSTAILPF